jgi:hypothetical protein
MKSETGLKRLLVLFCSSSYTLRFYSDHTYTSNGHIWHWDFVDDPNNGKLTVSTDDPDLKRNYFMSEIVDALVDKTVNNVLLGGTSVTYLEYINSDRIDKEELPDEAQD